MKDHKHSHQAHTSNSNKAKLDRKILKKYPSPDTSKHNIRILSGPIKSGTIYSFRTKSKMNNKIRQLKAEGIEFEILN